MVPEQAQVVLAMRLAGAQHDEWVVVVIDGALGRRDAYAAPIIAGVWADLMRAEHEDEDDLYASTVKDTMGTARRRSSCGLRLCSPRLEQSTRS
jgi:hypothetical protein